MGQRHRTADVPLPGKEELRAQAHGERHRIHVELQDVAQQVSAGLDPADVHEPGAAWKPVHHKDPEVAKEKLAKRDPHQAALEAEDVEAPHRQPPSQGRSHPPRPRGLTLDPVEYVVPPSAW